MAAKEQADSIAKALKSSGAVDVVGVVVEISVSQQKAQVLIADPSIPPNTFARVSLFGAIAQSLRQVSVGDVLRFNGLVAQKQTAKTNDLVGEFRMSILEAKTGWTRLCQPDTAQVSDDDGLASQVQELKRWFATTKFNDSIPALPVRRRQLNELNTTGMVCHVVVRVSSYDTAVSTQVAPRGKGRKRKHFSFSQKSTFAVLTDDTNVMPFMDCAAFESALTSAMHSGQQVWLTNVVTAADGGPNQSDIVLRPTDSTTVVPMLASPKPKPPTGQVAPGCLSLTQELPGNTTSTVVSPLLDVFIDTLGVSLGDGSHFVSPTGFVTTIIDQGSDQPCYRQATLTLNDGLVVRADASIMETLCGSVDAASMIKFSRLRFLALDLLHGLLEEQVPLNWTLSQEGNAYQITRCVLPRL